MGSAAPSILYDVLIIGAGLSGLQAALTCQNAGLSVLVLEARNRVGGKTLSTPRPDGKGKQELGAAWINDSNQSRMWELARRFGFAGCEKVEGSGPEDLRMMVVQNVSGDVVVQDSTGNTIRFPYGDVPEYPDPKDTADCIRIRDLVENSRLDPEIWTAGSSSRAELDKMTFERYLFEQGVGDKGRATAQVWTHAMLGVDPGEVSALYFLEYCKCGGGLMTMRGDCVDGGQYLRLKSGTSGFSEMLLKELGREKVRLGYAVEAVEQNEGKVTVRTENGELFEGRKAVVSVPTPVYKYIQWTPELPAGKKSVVSQTRYGCYTKYILLFEKPFWRDSGSCGLSMSLVGPVTVTRDTSVDDEGNFAMTCFIGGVFARRWSALTAEEKKSSVLKQLGDIFTGGRDISGLCSGAMESPWLDEQWSGWGCPCPVMAPGVLDQGFDALCAPFGDVHFVGTETATVWRGYMEGAIRSGERGGNEATKALAATSR